MSQAKIVLILFGVLIVVLAVLKPSGGILQRAATDSVTFMSDDHPSMQAAFKQARSGLDRFLALADAPPPDTGSFAVKVAVLQGRNKEYFWISPFARSGDAFTGRIDNTPQVVSTVKEGQEIRFGRDDVVDWTYEDRASGKFRGNFTACAMLSRESERDATEFKAQYGLDCE